jgi:hypothetical protein
MSSSPTRDSPLSHGAAWAGRTGLKLSRAGGFIGCSAFPECKFVRALRVFGGGDAEAEVAFPLVLGVDPESNLQVHSTSSCEGWTRRATCRYTAPPRVRGGPGEQPAGTQHPLV